MRDIKFRIWDKRCRLYLTLAGADWGGVEDRGTFCNFKYVHLFPPEGVPMRNPSPHYGGCLSFKLTDSVDNNRLVFEQYTGCKDKNGTEIHEGDVVKVEGDGEIYRVKWIRSGFGLEPRYNSPRYPVLGNVELRRKIEVIGNIHENPELLEEK